MHTGTKKYKLLHRVKDTRYFNIENLHHYSLSLLIGSNDFQICVTDSRNDTCLLLEDYIFPQANTPEDRVQVLRSLFDEHHFLLANFWQSVRISIKSKKFSLVPKGAFQENAMYDYLKYNAEIDPENESFHFNQLKYNEIVIIFAVEKMIREFFDSVYQHIAYKLVHQSSGMISGVFNSKSHQKDKKLYLYFDRGRLHILLLQYQKLIYYNQFLIKEFSDYFKYINLVARELKYNVQAQGIDIWGYIRKNSSHFKELKRYYQRMNFGSKPIYLKQGYMFDEIPDHHFLDIYGIYLCQA